MSELKPCSSCSNKWHKIVKGLCGICYETKKRREKGIKPQKILTPEERIVAKREWKAKYREKQRQAKIQAGTYLDPNRIIFTPEEKRQRKKESAIRLKNITRERNRANGNQKKWSLVNYKNNSARFVATARERQLKRKEQTLKNVKYSDLQVYYNFAKYFSDTRNVKHNVDHIIPLKHPDVCGLNVPWNLQVITEYENKCKSNKFDGTYDNLGWKDV